MKDEGVELYESCRDYFYEGEGSEHEGQSGGLFGSTHDNGKESNSKPSWLSRTLRSTLSPLVSTFSSSTSSSSPSLLGKRYEPGTFSTGQVHGEMKFDSETKKWEYRKLWVDIPKSGTIGARRVWIVKRLADVKR